MRARPTVLRGSATTIVVAVLLTLPAPAAAAPAVREQHRFAFLGCLGGTADGGTLALTVGVARFDTAIDLHLWEAGATPHEDPPAAGTSPDRPGTLTWEGDSITGATPVFDTATGVELGEATFAVTAAADGEPTEVFDGHTRNGNAVTRESGAFYRATVTATVAFPGAPAVSLEECDGFVGENAVFHNAPRAAVSGSDVSFADCDLTRGDRRLLVDLDSHSASVREYEAQADPDVEDPLLSGAVDETAFTTRSLSATVPMFTPSPDGGAGYAGDARISAVVDAGTATTSVARFLRGHVRTTTTPLTLSGAVTMPDGRSYDVAGCTAYRQVIQVQAVQ